MYSRPSLCRICEFPVADTGVRVAELDLQKLALWWLQEFETEFDDDADTIESSWICQFCLCDARLNYEEENQSSECDWWMSKITQNHMEFYFEGALIQQCGVQVSKHQLLTSKSFSHTSTVASSKQKSSECIPTECLHCGAHFTSRLDCIQHVLKSHKDLETFPCTICFLLFKSEKEKKNHYKITHHSHSIKCHNCDEKFITFSGLRHHMYSKHSKNGIVTCCNVSLNSFKDLSRHVRPSFYDRKKCIYCGLLIQASYLSRHINRQHKSVSIRCIYRNCNRHFLNNADKKKHISQVHESKESLTNCPYCQLKFAKSLLSRHILKIHQTQAIRCSSNICMIYFNTEEERRQHVSLVHKTGLKNHQNVICIYCNNVYVKKHHLYTHVKRKHADIMVRCAFQGCLKYFLSDSDLKTHVYEVHSEEVKKNKFCAKCNFITRCSMLLRHHYLYKHGTENVSCSKCSKMFTSSRALSYHVKGAHGAKKICEHCKKSFCKLTPHLQVRPCKHCGVVMDCISVQKLHLEKCKTTQQLKWCAALAAT